MCDRRMRATRERGFTTDCTNRATVLHNPYIEGPPSLFPRKSRCPSIKRERIKKISNKLPVQTPSINHPIIISQDNDGTTIIQTIFGPIVISR